MLRLTEAMGLSEYVKQRWKRYSNVPVSCKLLIRTHRLNRFMHRNMFQVALRYDYTGFDDLNSSFRKSDSPQIIVKRNCSFP